MGDIQNPVFCKNSQKPLIFLDVWQNSEYASVICYSLFEEIDDSNKIDSVAIKIYSF